MKVIFIVPSAISHRTSEENLGVGYLASVLRNNDINVIIIDAWLEGLSEDEIEMRLDTELKKNEKIIMYGISTYVSNLNSTSKIVSIIRKKDMKAFIVAGGFGPSFFVKKFLDVGIDVISIGEGEETILELCTCLKNELHWKNIPGIAFYQNGNIMRTRPRTLINDLDSIPIPARDTIEFVVKKKSSINILSSRGCKGHCVFCSVIAFQKLCTGEVWRQRSIKNFVDELEFLYDQGFNFFKVIDDSFIEYPRDDNWCKELFKEISSRNIKVMLRGSLVAERVTDETVYYLKKAGFFSIACGIENFSNTMLKRLGKRATKSDNIKALEVLKRHDLYVQCGFILFDPFTTLEELRENLFYMKKYNWVLCKGVFSELYAAEGTDFTNELLLNNGTGELIQKDENYIYRINDKKVYSIYCALKKWQKSYEHLYNLIIDPLTAPKNISFESMKCLYNIYLTIREKDLNLFEDLLNSDNDHLNIVENKIVESRNIRKNAIKQALKIYEKEEIVYDGELNRYL